MKILLSESKREDAVIDLLKKSIADTPYEKKIFIAGGYVRDELMGRDPKDIDLVVQGGIDAGLKAAEFIAKKLGIYKDGSNPVVYPKFGTAKITLRGKHQGVSVDGYDVEFVAPRKEKYEPGSRKPTVSSGTLEDDARRRDFTLNSLMKNLTTGEIKDLTGRGVKDLKKGLIRTSSDPDVIFKEDPLRLLRAVRFAAKYNFDIPLDLLRSIKKHAPELNKISKERIRDEMDKMLVTVKPSKAIRILKATHLLKYVVPELEELVGVTQGKHHKDDAFGHTMNVLDNAPPQLTQRLAALFHDIGKKATRTEKDGKVQFLDHEEIGAEIAGQVMRRLRYSNEDIAKIKKIVRHHMGTKHGGDDSSKMKDKTLRKFVHRAADVLEPLLDLIHADNISHAEKSSMPNQVAKIRERLKDWNLDDIIKPSLPLDGKDLIAMGAKGKLIGEIMNRLLEKWIEKGGLDKDLAAQIAQDMIRRSQKQNESLIFAEVKRKVYREF